MARWWRERATAAAEGLVALNEAAARREGEWAETLRTYQAHKTEVQAAVRLKAREAARAQQQLAHLKSGGGSSARGGGDAQRRLDASSAELAEVEHAAQRQSAAVAMAVREREALEARLAARAQELDDLENRRQEMQRLLTPR